MRTTAIRYILLILALLLPTAVAALYFVILVGGGKPNVWQQAVYLGGKALQFALPVLFVLLIERRLPLPTAPSFAGLLWGLAFGLAVAGTMLALYYAWLADTWLFEGVGVRVQQKLREVNLLSPARYIALAFVLSVAHSLAEEYYWRWFAFAQWRKLIGLPLAMTLSSLAFMGHHVLVLNAYFPDHFYLAVVPFSLAIAVGGAFWAWLFARTGTIYSSWLSHALVDLAIFAIGWDVLRRAVW